MRYDPFESMERFFDQMRRDVMDLREETVGDDFELAPWSARGLNMDLSEHDGEYVFTADLPGFEREEIDLRFDDGYLVLSAEHEMGDETTRRHRSIHERMSISVDVVEEDISATYRNGVLEVHLPVVEGAAEHGHEIDIN